jgi:hypothetical protein
VLVTVNHRSHAEEQESEQQNAVEMGVGAGHFRMQANLRSVVCQGWQTEAELGQSLFSDGASDFPPRHGCVLRLGGAARRSGAEGQGGDRGGAAGQAGRGVRGEL